MNVLLKGQLSFLKKKFKVFGVTSPGEQVKEIEEREGIRVHTIRMNRSVSPLRDFIALLRMWAFLRERRPDIVHTQTPKAGLIGILGARLAGIPNRVHSVVGLPVQEQQGFKKKLIAFVDKLVYRNATEVLSNSMGLRDYLKKNHYVRGKKIKVLGNGTTNGIDLEFFKDTDEIKIQAENICKELELTKKTTTFLFIGRIVKDKGVNELIEAFDKLSALFPHIKLLIVGKMEHKNPISKISEQLIEQNEQIIKVGYQTDIRPYLSLADYFVFPSYREGFPNVVLQAMAFNLPCIATDINGTNEVITQGKNGILVPVKDAVALYKNMQEALGKKDLAKGSMPDNRKMLKEKFDQAFVWEQYVKFYDSL
jgi:glycosyltransferase involved in cell wall biosynthesis